MPLSTFNALHLLFFIFKVILDKSQPHIHRLTNVFGWFGKVIKKSFMHKLTKTYIQLPHKKVIIISKIKFWISFNSYDRCLLTPNHTVITYGASFQTLLIISIPTPIPTTTYPPTVALAENSSKFISFLDLEA